MDKSKNSSEVDRKTAGAAEGGVLPEVVVTAKAITDEDLFETNPLHKFRSFNTIFTLGALPGYALNDSQKIRTSAEKFVVLKSSGKIKNDISPYETTAPEQEAETNSLVTDFNAQSPGRFDFYMNNIEIETLMAFSKTTNLTMATKLNFEVFEPLSINGFMEALQVAAVAAGHQNYISAPFVLKMEFIGYLDSEPGPTNSPTIAPDKRYFVITITKVEVDMNETGTRYRCQAVAHSELGYGDQNNLKQDIQMRGSTVGEVLTSLMKALTDASRDAAKKELSGNKKGNTEDEQMYDEYQIVFPIEKVDGSYDYGSKDKPAMNPKIANKKIHEITETPNIYTFPHMGTVEDAYANKTTSTTAPRSAGAGRGFVNPPTVVVEQSVEGQKKQDASYAYSAKDSSILFAQGAKIHDVISSVIRDSEFGRDIVRNPKKSIVNQAVDYVHIAIEVEIKKPWNKKTGTPVYIYRYVVLPYKLHYSRIPMFQENMDKQDEKDLWRWTRRKYSYLYTGQNLDIRSFNLKFNNLFYQAYPRGMGTYGLPPADAAVPENKAMSGKSLKAPAGENNADKKNKQKKLQDQVPLASRKGESKDIQKPGANAGKPNYYTYDALVGNMHQAILENLDMVTCEIEILGDPYFLCTGGIGDYRPALEDNTITKNGEAPYQVNDVVILLEFRNPVDYDRASGLVKFDKKRVPFSGCFRVTKVTSKFSDGLFTQRLFLIRIPGQAISTTWLTKTDDEKHAVFDDVQLPISDVS